MRDLFSDMQILITLVYKYGHEQYLKVSFVVLERIPCERGVLKIDIWFKTCVLE